LIGVISAASVDLAAACGPSAAKSALSCGFGRGTAVGGDIDAEPPFMGALSSPRAGEIAAAQHRIVKGGKNVFE